MTTSSDQWSESASGREYWNRQGRRFRRSFFGAPTTQLYLAEEQRLFRRHVGDLKGKCVLKLDLWNEAQNTEILFWAAGQGARCYGVDIAESTVRKARARSADLCVPVSIAVADVRSLPFPDGVFDCLYTMGTLEHLPDPRRAFEELARVVKPGGVAIVGVPNVRDPFLFALASRLLQAVGRYPYGYERWYTNAELGAILRAQGFLVVRRDGILLLPWFVRMLDMHLWMHWPAACSATDVLLHPFRLLARSQRLVERFGYLTVCVAEKQP